MSVNDERVERNNKTTLATVHEGASEREYLGVFSRVSQPIQERLREGDGTKHSLCYQGLGICARANPQSLVA